MAHFAELDENNVVLRVIVIADADTSDIRGIEKESIGAAFCEKLFGGKWVKTSYNGKIRFRYAGVGYTFDPVLDAFIPPKPFNSWVLNKTTAGWEAPVPMPNDGCLYFWDEPSLSWIKQELLPE